MPAKPHPRSRVAGVPIDRRTLGARQFAAAYEQLLAQAGGAEVLTATELETVHAAASLTMQVKQLTARAARGEPLDGDVCARLANCQRRALRDVRWIAAAHKKPKLVPFQFPGVGIDLELLNRAISERRTQSESIMGRPDSEPAGGADGRP